MTQGIVAYSAGALAYNLYHEGRAHLPLKGLFVASCIDLSAEIFKKISTQGNAPPFANLANHSIAALSWAFTLRWETPSISKIFQTLTSSSPSENGFYFTDILKASAFMLPSLAACDTLFKRSTSTTPPSTLLASLSLGALGALATIDPQSPWLIPTALFLGTLQCASNWAARTDETFELSGKIYSSLFTTLLVSGCGLLRQDSPLNIAQAALLTHLFRCTFENLAISPTVALHSIGTMVTLSLSTGAWQPMYPALALFATTSSLARALFSPLGYLKSFSLDAATVLAFTCYASRQKYDHLFCFDFILIYTVDRIVGAFLPS